MTKESCRIVFMGTPELSATILSNLIDNGFNIVGVISQPRKPVGRKKELLPTPVEEVAILHNIPVFQPVKIKEDYSFLPSLKPDLIVTLAYGQIIPQGVIDIPTLGCVNLHGSLLPKYRGAAPIQYAIINGDRVFGFCLMEMTAKMDAGRVYSSYEIALDQDINYSDLLKQIETTLKPFSVISLTHYIEGKLVGIPQNENYITFAPSIKPEQEHLNLSLGGKELVNWIRALAMHPGAYLFLGEEKIKIYQAKMVSSSINKPVGTIIRMDKNGVVMQAVDGEIALLSLQLAGKKIMTASDFANGYKSLIGKVLS